jgi:hypothetical protein
MFLHDYFGVILISPFVSTTTVSISLGGDSYYLHRLVYRNMVGLRVTFGAPLTGLNSPAVHMTFQGGAVCVPQMYGFVVSYCL